MSKFNSGKDYFPKDIHVLDEKSYRAYVSKVMAVANKRLGRLEKNDLHDSPAYQKWLSETGGARFGVRGKKHSEVVQQVAALRKFIESDTSTVRGLNTTLKNMAKVTGVKFDNMKDLQSKAKNFFELSSKVEQYLRSIDDIASAIGYQKIWEAVNQYVKSENVDLSNADNDIEDLTKTISDLLSQHSQGKLVDPDEAMKIAEKGFNDLADDFIDDISDELTKTGWFKLLK